VGRFGYPINGLAKLPGFLQTAAQSPETNSGKEET
jgi:hypothetical protein